MLLVMPAPDANQETPLERLSNLVRVARAKSGFTLQEIQKRGGPAPSLVSDLETGKKLEIPKPSTLAKLAKGLGVPVDDVMMAAGLLMPVAGMSSATTDQPIGDRSETRKPWTHHDSSHTDKGKTDTTGGIAPGNELSTLDENPSKTDTRMVNLNRRTGDVGHMQMFPADLGPVRRLPVFRVSCGERVLINDEPQEWQTWPVIMTGPVDGIMIVEGTSMLGCGYQPGDQLFFQIINGKRPQDGDRVIAEVEGGAVCKLYKRDNSGEYLVSAPGEATSFFARVTEAVRLVGIVKKRLTDG